MEDDMQLHLPPPRGEDGVVMIGLGLAYRLKVVPNRNEKLKCRARTRRLPRRSQTHVTVAGLHHPHVVLAAVLGTGIRNQIGTVGIAAAQGNVRL